MPVSVVVAACFLALLISSCIRHSQPSSAHLATTGATLLAAASFHFSSPIGICISAISTSYSPFLLRRLLCAFFLTTRRYSSFLFFLSARLGFPTTTASPLPPSLLALSPTSRSRRDLLPAAPACHHHPAACANATQQPHRDSSPAQPTLAAKAIVTFSLRVSISSIPIRIICENGRPL